MGAMARQGPHHVAQKSTSTGLSDFKTSWSKFASVTSTIPLPAMFVSPRRDVASAAHAPSSVVAGARTIGTRFPNPGGSSIVPLQLDARSKGKVALREGRIIGPGDSGSARPSEALDRFRRQESKGGKQWWERLASRW